MCYNENIMEQKRLKNFYVVDDFINQRDLLPLYNRLTDTPSWKINKVSNNTDNVEKKYQTFPGMYIYEDGQVLNPYLFGYFECLTRQCINKFFEEQQFELPTKIWRMHIGAKNDWSETGFHSDHVDPNAWTILSIFTPFFNTEQGGEFIIQDEKVAHKPGRAIIFPSNIPHNGLKTTSKLDYWKLALTTILHPTQGFSLDFNFR